ncbi:MAG: hypothetical protein WC878_01740 [Candidatus Paceibacterota bacterium]|jgi:hypothetical protein
MSEETKFERGEVEKNGVLHSGAIEYVQSRLIPDIELMLSGAGDETGLNDFKEKLAEIKTDMETPEKDPKGDQMDSERADKICDRAKKLSVRISEKVPETDKATELPPSVYLSIMETQWFPDIASLLPDVSDKKKRDDFETELAEIKSEMGTLEKALADNEESAKEKIKEAYVRTENLLGRVDKEVPEEEEEI